MLEQENCCFCKHTLPEIENMKYCPFCGVNLSLPKAQAVVAKIEQDNIQQEVLLPENKKSLVKSQSEVRGKYEKIAEEQKVKFLTPEENYTLIIKGCDNKLALIECLNHILLRGETAVKMAVAGMPSMLLYKVTKQAVDTVAKALKDFDVVYSIVEGDLDSSGFYKSEYFKQLTPAGRAVLKGIDKTMWIGEKVLFITENIVFEGQEGYAILSENAFFFFAKGGNSNDNCFLPVYKLENIDLWENNGRFLGEWVTVYGRGYQMEFNNWQDYNAMQQIAENLSIV